MAAPDHRSTREPALLAALGDAVVVAGRDGHITGWLGGAETLFGYSAQEAVGRPLTWLFPDARPRDLAELGDLGGAPELHTVVPLRRGHGASLSAALHVTPLRDADGQVVGTVGIFKPIGDWLDPAEAAGPGMHFWNRALGELVRALLEDAGRDPAVLDDTQSLCRLLVRQGRQLLPDAECVVLLVPRERQQNFRFVAGAGPWAEAQVGEERSLAGTLAGIALAGRRPVETVRLQELSADGDILARGPLHTGRLVPLWSARPLPDGRTSLGLLGFCRKERAYFTPFERRLIAEFSRLVSVTLQRTELRRSAAEAALRLQTGIDVAVDLAASLEPTHVVQRLVRRAAQAVGADRATLIGVEGDTAVVEDSYDAQAEQAPVGRRFPITSWQAEGQPLLHFAIRDRQPHLCGAFTVEGMEDGQALAGVQNAILLPLVFADQVSAVLVVARRSDPAFEPGELATLQLIGNVAVLALRNARLFAEAQVASRLKGDFLNMAAHELRTPLTVVTGYLSMMGDGSFGSPPAGWQQPIALLSEKSEELGRLVDDLLLTSRLESGRLPAQVESVDLREVVAEAARRAEARVHLLAGEMEVATPAEPVEVAADRGHLARILDNLLNNALTHGRRDEGAWARIVIELEPGQAVVAVEDRGRGVNEAAQARIFERFGRSPESDHLVPGAGLGLYISRELAARNGGRVTLDRSDPHRGSRFALRLPRATVR